MKPRTKRGQQKWESDAAPKIEMVPMTAKQMEDAIWQLHHEIEMLKARLICVEEHPALEIPPLQKPRPQGEETLSEQQKGAAP